MQVPVAIVATLAAALIAAGSATAQVTLPEGALPPIEPPVEILPPVETAPGDTLPSAGLPPDLPTSLSPDAARAAQRAHLDALFEQLSNPDNQHWQRVQSQILAAWSASGSPSMDLLAMRADEAMERQDMDTALTFLNDLVRLAPGFAEGWNKRATVYFLRDDYRRSMEDIARVLTLEPRHFGAYAGLGIILDRLGDKKGALQAYRRATEIHPHLPGAADGIRKLTREVEGERT